MKKFSKLFILMIIFSINSIVGQLFSEAPDSLKPILTATPKFVDFDTVLYRSVNDTIIVIKNSGKSTLIVSETNYFSCVFTKCTSFTLEPDSTKIIPVRFYAVIDSKVAGYMCFTCNTDLSDTIIFTGFGALPQKIGIDFNETDFKTVEISKSKELPFAISNLGDINLFDTITIYGPNKNEFHFANGMQTDHIILGGRSTKYCRLIFSPESEGQKTAYLLSKSNSSENSTNIITLTGLGVESSSVEEINKQNEIISLSPNPASSLLQIQLPEDSPNTSLDIVNIYGAVVYSQANIPNQTSPLSINIQSLPPGLYYCLIKSKGKVEAEKFLILR